MPAPRVHPMPAVEGTAPHPQQRRVCFSFAAYAKAVINQLRASGVSVKDGLSDVELSGIESSHGFDFPPDLRSILQEGLPVGAGFPNWRSTSPQHLRDLLRLPALGLLHEVSRGWFWCEAAWGSKPDSPAAALRVAKEVVDAAPALVPIYRHFYMPSRPNLAGNPVFSVRGGKVRCVGFDLTDFFLREEFHKVGRLSLASSSDLPPVLAPAWAATSARRIEVWTDLVHGGGSAWRPAWSTRRRMGPQVEKLLQEVEWKLREGGWSEREVREMLAAEDDEGPGDRAALPDRDTVEWNVQLQAVALLRAGWSEEDVAYSLGEGGGEDSRDGGGRLKETTWHAMSLSPTTDTTTSPWSRRREAEEFL